MSGVSIRQRFVLDTSVYVAEAIRRGDESLAEAVDGLLDLIARVKLELAISCHTDSRRRPRSRGRNQTPTVPSSSTRNLYHRRER